LAHANYGKQEASPDNKVGQHPFIEERRKLQGVVLNKSSLEAKRDFEVAAVSH